MGLRWKDLMKMQGLLSDCLVFVSTIYSKFSDRNLSSLNLL